MLEHRSSEVMLSYSTSSSKPLRDCSMTDSKLPISKHIQYLRNTCRTFSGFQIIQMRILRTLKRDLPPGLHYNLKEVSTDPQAQTIFFFFSKNSNSSSLPEDLQTNTFPKIYAAPPGVQFTLITAHDGAGELLPHSCCSSRCFPREPWRLWGNCWFWSHHV